MKITCDGCGQPVERNDRVALLKGAFKNREVVLGYSTKRSSDYKVQEIATGGGKLHYYFMGLFF